MLFRSNPVRYLSSPVLAAMLVMLPMLTYLADLSGLLGGAVFSNFELGLSYSAYADRTLDALVTDDVMQGLIKSLVFGVTVTFVALLQGYTCSPTPEGVSAATTRTVVLSSLAVLALDFMLTALMFSI